nr:hypothetical protein [Streptomyces sp. TP-A0874]
MDQTAHPTEQADSTEQGPTASTVDNRDERGRTASLAATAGRGVGSGLSRSWRGTRVSLTGIAERIVEVAPRIPVRDLAALRVHHPGVGPEQLADRLVAGATKGSAAVGAGVGAAAMLPVPPAMPAELAAEVIGVASIEFKLIAELHEVYGVRPPGNLGQRSTAYLGAWSRERGIDVSQLSSLDAALGGQVRRELRRQVMKRSLRTLPNLTPFLLGAVVGAVLNVRRTSALAEKVRSDLRVRQIRWDLLEGAPQEPGSPKSLQ